MNETRKIEPELYDAVDSLMQTYKRFFDESEILRSELAKMYAKSKEESASYRHDNHVLKSEFSDLLRENENLKKENKLLSEFNVALIKSLAEHSDKAEYNAKMFEVYRLQTIEWENLKAQKPTKEEWLKSIEQNLGHIEQIEWIDSELSNPTKDGEYLVRMELNVYVFYKVSTYKNEWTNFVPGKVTHWALVKGPKL